LAPTRSSAALEESCPQIHGCCYDPSSGRPPTPNCRTRGQGKGYKAKVEAGERGPKARKCDFWQPDRSLEGQTVEDWPGIVICANRHTKNRLGARVRYIDVIDLTQRIGALSHFVQASSGHIMTCLSQVMGAVRGVLVGFECKPVNGRTHGHDDYNQFGDMAAFDGQFLLGWRGLAPFLKIEMINATPDSAIDCFPFMSLEDALLGTQPRLAGGRLADAQHRTA
jgi:hypothetical protein